MTEVAIDPAAVSLRERKKQATRHSIHETALRLLGERGPDGVTIEEICAQVGVSPRTFFNYYPTKIAAAFDLVEAEISGLFHIGGGIPISWFQFARLIFEAAGIHPVLLATNEREYRTPARRPKYSALSNGKMERTGLVPMPPLQKVLASYFAGRALASTPKKSLI